MTLLDKLLGIAGIGSTIANAALLRRFLTGVMLAIVLAAVSGTLIGAVLIAALYGIYFALVANGVHQLTAGLVVGGAVIAVTVLLTTLAWLRFRRLHAMSRHLESPGSILNHVTKMADAFLDGLLTERRR